MNLQPEQQGIGGKQLGLPGLHGTEHIGFTVPDLDEAERFFVDVIGCELAYGLGPFEDSSGRWMAEQMNVHPRAIMQELRFFRCKNGPNFEVFQWTTPDNQSSQPKNTDIGGHHLAFYVEKMQPAINHLVIHGVQILGAPVKSRGPSLGQEWVYFLTPWGMQCELVSFPEGKAHEQGSDTVLWHPQKPAQ